MMQETALSAQAETAAMGVVRVVEADDRCPVLIGQVPLELLDFLVDPVGQRLIGNPAHGGEHMIEVL